MKRNEVKIIVNGYTITISDCNNDITLTGLNEFCTLMLLTKIRSAIECFTDQHIVTVEYQ